MANPVAEQLNYLSGQIRRFGESERADKEAMAKLGLQGAQLDLQQQNMLGQNAIELAKAKRDAWLREEVTGRQAILTNPNMTEEQKKAAISQIPPEILDTFIFPRGKWAEGLQTAMDRQRTYEQKKMQDERMYNLALAKSNEPTSDFKNFAKGFAWKHPELKGGELAAAASAEWHKMKQQEAINISTSRAEATKNVYNTDAQKIGDAIIAGKQPPKIQGFGMSKIAPQIKSYLAEKGFDLAKAELDWEATKKHIGSLNSTQQLRLRQSVNFAYESLGKVKELAKAWDAGAFPILNKVNMTAAINGVYGTEAQKIATQLKTQIADLTSELGTVYKGGNSSTDESLKLAATNLNENWSYEQLMGNIDLVEANLGYRKNSLRQTTVAGVSGKSPYKSSGQSEVQKAPPEAIEYLKQHPMLKNKFKEKYGYLPEGF